MINIFSLGFCGQFASVVCRILCTFIMTVQIDQEEEMAGMEVGV